MGTIPDIGLGTGGYKYLSGDECINIVSTALEVGYRHLDTAQRYGNEEAVGQGISHAVVPREEITVGTKLDRTNLAYEDVLRTARESAQRLNLDTIDILYVHFPSGTYDPEETLVALCELVEDGLVDNIGVSNFSPEQVDEALSVADCPIIANQCELHPLYQRHDLIEHAWQHDMYVVAYSPLAQGAVFDVPELTEVAEKRGLSEAEVTLAWLTGKENVVAIPKTTSEAHLRTNLEAETIELKPEDVELIESIAREEPIYAE